MFSIVIPVYQNAGTLKPLYENLKNEFEKINESFEVCFVNDGSTDNSLLELEGLHTTYDNVIIVELNRNFGQVPAITAGLTQIKGDAAIVMSADMQDPTDLIPKMIDAWKNKNEIVVAFRDERNDGYFRNTTSRFFYTLIKKYYKNMPNGGFDFYLLDKKAYKIYTETDVRNRFMQGDILWLGLNVSFIPYKRLERKTGKSQWSLLKRYKYFWDALVSSTYLPIRFIILLGLFVSFSGFIYAIIVAYARYIHAVPFKGYAPIVILLLLIGGVIMLMLGVIGEYIWRIYDETKKRPNYLIKRIRKK